MADSQAALTVFGSTVMNCPTFRMVLTSDEPTVITRLLGELHKHKLLSAAFAPYDKMSEQLNEVA